MPVARQCARNFCYKRPLLDPDEMEAEAYFILSMIFLTGYSIKEGMIVDREDIDFVKHVKSRIYRDLGTYTRPTQAKAHTFSLSGEVYIKSFEGDYYKVDRFQPTVNFAIPLFEIIESLVKTELEMRVINCYLKGITDDLAIKEILKINIQKVVAIRTLLVDRLNPVKSRKTKDEIKRTLPKTVGGVKN